MIRILVVDDHIIVREGLKQILKDEQDIRVEDEASDGFEAMCKIEAGNFDVILMDITMPNMSGLAVLNELEKRKPNVPVLILSIHPEEQYAIRALKAGASGYLTKDSAPDELVKAIRKVSTGKRFISPSLAERLVDNLTADSEKPLHQKLSDREFQVMCMIARGKTSSEIAEKLFLSPKTISTYRSRLLRKLGLTNNSQIIRYAIRNRLIQ